MILKTLLCVAVLSLTACSSSEQSSEGEETSQTEDTVIELESNEEENESVNFNKNNNIKSDIYKEYFFTKELLKKDRMESDLVGNNKVAEGNQLPVSTEDFPEPYYMNYAYNTVDEKLDLALILTEGSVVKEKELTEDVFVHLEYDIKNDSLIDITQENASGNNADQFGLTEEEWGEVANRYIRFVDSIN
ncbi:hypothetical protein [Alkalibacterium kapii]|uniref:DUF4767 domain-containing protein n=1 Tax=Alkalibacterium kapii TaxID=426704 RepID=A0A511AR99_9LACT|nr:hypothetical protein [Alkalibacterium kapii]GEK90735.1 hypothetical protein AKA01nite_03570 [Alkalibacterium kapii]